MCRVAGGLATVGRAMTGLEGATIRGAGPLYEQVKDLLTRRISSGEWQPGQLIPGEARLAEVLEISKGTVRKAIDDLVARHLLVRQQGVGTFVSVHDTRRALFRFFHMVAADGSKALPDSVLLRCHRARARREEARALGLATGRKVVRIERVRRLDGEPAISEDIAVAADRFPDLSAMKILPNTLYELYQREYGITIHRAEERLGAIAADERDAARLGCAVGHPLLEIERIALTLDDTPVELRISRCATGRYRYQNSIS